MAFRDNFNEKANPEIREAARDANLPLWRLANMYGVSEATMTRMMRCELPPEKKKEMLYIIHRFQSGSDCIYVEK